MKEALLLHKVNTDTKRRDLMNKEMMALEKLNTRKFHSLGHRMGSGYQRAPLRIIFDAKKEYQR